MDNNKAQFYQQPPSNLYIPQIPNKQTKPTKTPNQSQQPPKDLKQYSQQKPYFNPIDNFFNPQIEGEEQMELPYNIGNNPFGFTENPPYLFPSPFDANNLLNFYHQQASQNPYDQQAPMNLDSFINLGGESNHMSFKKDIQDQNYFDFFKPPNLDDPLKNNYFLDDKSKQQYSFQQLYPQDPLPQQSFMPNKDTNQQQMYPINLKQQFNTQPTPYQQNSSFPDQLSQQFQFFFQNPGFLPQQPQSKFSNQQQQANQQSFLTQPNQNMLFQQQSTQCNFFPQNQDKQQQPNPFFQQQLFPGMSFPKNQFMPMPQFFNPKQNTPQPYGQNLQQFFQKPMKKEELNQQDERQINSILSEMNKTIIKNMTQLEGENPSFIQDQNIKALIQDSVKGPFSQQNIGKTDGFLSKFLDSRNLKKIKDGLTKELIHYFSQINLEDLLNFSGRNSFGARNQKKIGQLTYKERQQKIQKYKQKKMNRQWDKKINYDCRKKVADTRERIKGRFVTKTAQSNGSKDQDKQDIECSFELKDSQQLKQQNEEEGQLQYQQYDSFQDKDNNFQQKLEFKEELVKVQIDQEEEKEQDPNKNEKQELDMNMNMNKKLDKKIKIILESEEQNQLQNLQNENLKIENDFMKALEKLEFFEQDQLNVDFEQI